MKLSTTSKSEAMFCAFEPSHCIDEIKGCLCADCEMFRVNGMYSEFYFSPKNNKKEKMSSSFLFLNIGTTIICSNQSQFG
ncbi:MAG: DUF2769 domain-containing protein [Eubacteriaceae bacterium]|nr:DUF2769 domain-containing protein [Eubacteriaceae bacterium]